MAGDFDASLPVRTVPTEELQVQTKTGTFLAEDLVKLNGNTVSTNAGTVDAGTLRVTLPSDQASIGVKLQDGTGNAITSTGGALDVNILTPITIDSSIDESTGDTILVYGWDGSANKKIKTNAAGELQVDVLSQPALSHTTDSIRLGDGTNLTAVTASNELKVLASAQPGVDIGDVTINNGSGAAAVNIQDGGNTITVDGTIAATQSGTWNITNISGTISLPSGASTLAEQQTQTTSLQLIDDLPLAQGSTTSGEKGILSMGAVTTAAPSYTTGQTSPLSLTTSGELRVAVTSTAGDHTNVFSQSTSADIATNATSTHTYTPGTDFYLTDVYGSASGKHKVEIQTGTTGSETTKVVLFATVAGVTHWHLPEPLKVLTTESVKVIRTNLDNQAQPLYSTVQGYL